MEHLLDDHKHYLNQSKKNQPNYQSNYWKEDPFLN